MTKALVGRARMLAAAAVMAAAWAAGPAWADEMPVFKVELKDGTITPRQLEVPADRAFKLDLHNTGKTPAEFESLPLRLEKVLAPESRSPLVIRRLRAGSYEFFDDFHPDAPPALLIAK